MSLVKGTRLAYFVNVFFFIVFSIYLHYFINLFDDDINISLFSSNVQLTIHIRTLTNPIRSF